MLKIKYLNFDFENISHKTICTLTYYCKVIDFISFANNNFKVF